MLVKYMHHRIRPGWASNPPNLIQRSMHQLPRQPHVRGKWKLLTVDIFYYSDSWEVIFSKSTDTVSAVELDCCRRVVQLCKDCLLVVYQFANDVNGHIQDKPGEGPDPVAASKPNPLSYSSHLR